MADLEDALARVPGLAGYLGQEQVTQRRNAGELNNALTATKLQDHFREQEYRSGLRPDMSSDEVLSRAYKYLGPEKAATLAQGHQDRQAQQSVQRDVATSRLMQAASQFDRNMSAKDRAQKLKEISALYNLPADLADKVANLSMTQGGAAPQQPQMPYNEAMAVAKARQAAGQPVGEIPTDQNSPQPVQGPPQGAPVPSEAQVQTGGPPPPVAPPAAPVAAPMPPQGAPVARGEIAPPPGAPVARLPDLPKPPPELEAVWAGMGRKDADKARAQWMAKNIGGSQLDESAVKVAAWEKLLYGTDIKGMGNSSAQQRAQVGNERARIGRELGLTDTEMAMMPQDNKVKMKAVDKLTTWGSFVDKAADQIVPSIDLAIDYAKKLGPTQLQTLNKLIIAGKTEFNSPDANAYAVAVNTVRREYGRLMSGPTSNAMLPVEAMKHADQLVSTAMDVPTWNEVKKVIVKDSTFTREAVKKQIDSIRGTIASPGAKPAEAANDRSVTVGGKTYNFPTPAAAAEFKRKAGL